MRANIGVNEQEVHVTCAYCTEERVWYVHSVLFKGTDIRGCLSQPQLDELAALWILNEQCEGYTDGR